MAKKIKMVNISKNTQEAVTRLSNKFNPGEVSRFLSGKKSSLATKQKDYSFVGKIRPMKSENIPANKITSIDGGDDKFVDTLIKIYSFMKKNYESDLKQKTKEKNFEEERILENKDGIRHKQLLDAINSLKFQLQSQVGVESSGPSFDLPDFPPYIRGPKDKPKPIGGKGVGKADKITKSTDKRGRTVYRDSSGKFVNKPTATKMSRVANAARGISEFLTKHLGGIAMAAIAAMEINNAIKAHEAGEIDDRGLHEAVVSAIGSAVGGAGGISLGAALGSLLGPLGTIAGSLVGGYYGADFGRAAAEKLFDYLSDDDEDAYEKLKKLLPNLDTNLSSLNDKQKQKMSSPMSPAVASTPAASPAPSTPSIFKSYSSLAKPNKASAMQASSGDRLNTVVAENVGMKLNSGASKPSVSTVNNLTTTASKKESQAFDLDSVPPVRNLEPTFQNMILYSTRVV